MTIPRSALSAFCPLIQCLPLTHCAFSHFIISPLSPAPFALPFKLLFCALFLNSYSVPSFGSPFSLFHLQLSHRPFALPMVLFSHSLFAFLILRRTRDRVVTPCAREPAQRAAPRLGKLAFTILRSGGLYICTQ